MNNTEPKIRFYSMDGNKIEDLEIKYDSEIDNLRDLKTSESFNKALKIVIQKDINVLSDKLEKHVKDVVKCFTMCGDVPAEKFDYNIENIDLIITKVEELLSDLIIKKDGIKIGFLSSNKKEKKTQIKRIEDSIIRISKCQNDIISIKNEYDKLKNRNQNISSFDFGEENDDEEKEDPLERTINFYMAKEN